MLRGYQILGFRLRSRVGEIDILARRGATFWPSSRSSVARPWRPAINALTADQHERLLAAGRSVLKGRPGLAGLSLRIDVVALAPGRFHVMFVVRGSQEGRFP